MLFSACYREQHAEVNQQHTTLAMTIPVEEGEFLPCLVLPLAVPATTNLWLPKNVA